MASLSFHPDAFLSPSLLSSARSHRCHFSPLSSSVSLASWNSSSGSVFCSRRLQTTTKLFASASSSPSFDDLDSRYDASSRPKKMLLSDLIQEIEPLDISVIQKDVSPTTIDAMKRTISGILGLLPSNQFQVLIEALWESLYKLLVSSMMTGYTLRNAEYRLCLERNLGIHDDHTPYDKSVASRFGMPDLLFDSVRTIQAPGETGVSVKSEEVSKNSCEELNLQNLGGMTPETQSYILHLQSFLSSVKKELHEVKRKNADLQMQQFVGEEKNDLLDYLRSLQPEKVAELSEPTSPEVRKTIYSVVHGLLATLSPKMQSKAPSSLEKSNATILNIGDEDWAELVENTSLPFQPMISLTRDYLARLLFWCMLLGHYLRGLEYRIELTEVLSRSSNTEDDKTSQSTEVA